MIWFPPHRAKFTHVLISLGCFFFFFFPFLIHVLKAFVPSPCSLGHGLKNQSYCSLRTYSVQVVHPFNITFIFFILSDQFELKDREDFQYDIFVTFSTLDYPWVRDNLVPLLERRQINYCIHSRDFVIGKAILENMADSVYNSRKVLAVISENYLASKFCRQELDMALYRSVSVAPNPSLLLIRVDDVDKKKLPKSLQKQTFLDYTSAMERNKWEERLLKHIDISFVEKDENLLASEISTSV